MRARRGPRRSGLRRRLPRAAAVALILGAVLGHCAGADSRVVSLDSGWAYTTAPAGSSPPGADASWTDTIERRPGDDTWYRVAVPTDAPPRGLMIFRSYVGAFEVYADAHRIYAFHDPAARGQLSVHTIALPETKVLYLKVPPAERPPFFGGAPVIAPSAAAPRAAARIATGALRSDVIDLGIGALLFVIGCFAVVASRLRRRGNAAALLWFGAFTALYGLRLLVDSALPSLVGISRPVGDQAVAVITYVITIPGWMMASAFLGGGVGGSLRWQVFAFAAFAPIAIAWELLTGRPSALGGINNFLVIVGGINLLVNVIAVKRARTGELLVVLAGSVLFLAFALVNNLAALELLPWREVDETLGFLVFIACLGYAAMRTFTRSERARVALHAELSAAREIQRSILPRDLPEVHGLRIHARYDPASSVAGDLYDVLPLDASRAAVLVADVAGHGIPAALIAAMVKVAASSRAAIADDPAAMLSALNEALRRDVRRAFVTATCLFFDSERRTVAVANAGHPAPLLIRGDASFELGAPGVLLGRFPADYRSTVTTLAEGDRVAAWTDGIPEARNARGEAFGEERLHRLLADGASADAIVDAVRRWRDPDAPEEADDLTIVIVDVSSGGPAS